MVMEIDIDLDEITEINFTVSNNKGPLVLILNSNIHPEEYDIEETRRKGIILADWLDHNAPYHLTKAMVDRLRENTTQYG